VLIDDLRPRRGRAPGLWALRRRGRRAGPIRPRAGPARHGPARTPELINHRVHKTATAPHAHVTAVAYEPFGLPGGWWSHAAARSGRGRCRQGRRPLGPGVRELTPGAAASDAARWPPLLLGNLLSRACKSCRTPHPKISPPAPLHSLAGTGPKRERTSSGRSGMHFRRRRPKLLAEASLANATRRASTLLSFTWNIERKDKHTGREREGPPRRGISMRESDLECRRSIPIDLDDHVALELRPVRRAQRSTSGKHQTKALLSSVTGLGGATSS
jgi:hypothetical protein